MRGVAIVGMVGSRGSTIDSSGGSDSCGGRPGNRTFIQVLEY